VLDDAGCRFVTRLKKNTPFSVVEENRVPKNSNIVSDRIGHLPARLANSRKNPLQVPVREINVIIDSGKLLRIVTNDLDAPAQEIADLYKQRWQIELFFSMGQTGLENQTLSWSVRKRGPHPNCGHANCFSSYAFGAGHAENRPQSTTFCPPHPGKSHA